jgi:hypothetical protein
VAHFQALPLGDLDAGLQNLVVRRGDGATVALGEGVQDQRAGARVGDLDAATDGVGVLDRLVDRPTGPSV